MCPPLESPRLALTTLLAVPAGEYTAWCRQNFLHLSSRSDARGLVRHRLRWMFEIYALAVGRDDSARHYTFISLFFLTPMEAFDIISLRNIL